MEARAEFRQPRISKGLVAIVAVSITLGLGVMAGTVAKNLDSSAAATQNHTVLQGKGGLAVQSVRHGGMQTVEENLAPAATRGVSPDAQDRKAQTAAPKYFSPDRLGFREG